MTHIASVDILAIVKLAIYSILFLPSIALLFRHGFSRSTGWLQLSIFCLIRLMGSAAQIATVHSNSLTPYIMADVLLVIGLAPLLVVSLGLLSRAMKPMLPSERSVVAFRIFSQASGLISLAGLILCIVGATNVNSLSQLTNQPLLNAGKILFAVTYCAIAGLTIIAGLLHRSIRRQGGTEGEGVLIAAVAVALPLILVRLVYAYLSSWGSDRAKFSPFTGNLGIQIGMSVWEEIVVTALFIIVGFMVPRLPKEVNDHSSRSAVGTLQNAQRETTSQEMTASHWYDNNTIQYIPIARLVAKAAKSHAGASVGRAGSDVTV